MTLQVRRALFSDPSSFGPPRDNSKRSGEDYAFGVAAPRNARMREGLIFKLWQSKNPHFSNHKHEFHNEFILRNPR